MQAERDEEIAPILEELKEETGKLNELTDAKNELDDEVTKLSSLNEEYTAKIKELEEQLKAAEEDIESHTKNLEESSAKLEETNKEIQELTQSTETELGQIDDEHKKLDEEIGTLSQTKQQHLDDKTKQKAEIKQQLAARVEEEHAINSELPEHLRKDVNEKKLADTSSLFSDEAAPEPEVKAEPVTKTDKPSATAATVKTKKVKASRIKRLSNFFKSKPPTPTKVPVKVSDIKKANSKADIKKEPVDVKSQKTTDSYDGFEEEIPPNKGGLFKEEI
ncbi:hypothetical protein CANTEDRAFT_114260 [Yamadazyma tenuis ATCC 10573]|uniref:Uncharacterized protein n=2 Tax=Candida tenuis TaxID=2315449 RepID=G3B3N6_CANTC|nr:uncharacterized protein CANTEDRAFT_114260 [Yamadazyma tenuis ATCC 10573]XP_006686742.1 uncharacterized protein CANTEDRAFT_114260 [Yamadazyma tenuis ATCC 10573]EGV64427.1 hypothetical protein CANTEDRAFT_114260 [Yamadazyma tenuis ATCC 10573]EGV64428.1 hypothetical protein CANTEDRAFT_114260 [Yamadazyma tenuis ATCC 10573]